MSTINSSMQGDLVKFAHIAKGYLKQIKNSVDSGLIVKVKTPWLFITGAVGLGYLLSTLTNKHIVDFFNLMFNHSIKLFE
jgi:hypothetical protein